MSHRSLQIQQLDSKMRVFKSTLGVATPSLGWIKAIRTALGMSMQQLGDKLNISKQAVQDMEKREIDGAITIKSLKETARTMDMKLVYGFVPNDGTLEALIERKAKELATQIVLRTSANMKLEDQANSNRRIAKAIKERTEELKRDLPRMLWD